MKNSALIEQNPSALRALKIKMPGRRTLRFLRRVSGGMRSLPPLFRQRLIFSDGSSIVRSTVSPAPLVVMSRDCRNHPAWTPAAKNVLLDEKEDSPLSRFKQRYSAFEYKSVASESRSSDVDSTEKSEGR